MLLEWHCFVRLSQSCGVFRAFDSFRAIDFLQTVTSVAFLRLFVILEDALERPMQLHKAENLHE